MKRSMLWLGYGIVSVLLTGMICYFAGGIHLLRTVESWISVALFGSAILLSGTLVKRSSARHSVYTDHDDDQTRGNRSNVVTCLVTLGIPHLLLTFYLYS